MTVSNGADYVDIIDAARQSPVIVAKCIGFEVIARIEAWINAQSKTQWCSGDESAHSWSEFHFAPEALCEFMIDVPLLDALSHRAITMVSWVNRFEQGQWIAAHRDAGGDLQCIVPIVAPIPSQGGQLWINSPRQVVPAHAGDVLVFNAAKRLHGTNPVSEVDAHRVTLNIRFWMRG